MARTKVKTDSASISLTAQADTPQKKPHSTALVDAEARLEEKKGKRGRPPTTTRDAVLALQKRTLGKNAGAILQRLVDGALDKTDPNHELCLRLAIERIAPVRFWNNASDADQGVSGGGGEGSTGPRVSINVILPEQGQPVRRLEAIEIPSREVEQ